MPTPLDQLPEADKILPEDIMLLQQGGEDKQLLWGHIRKVTPTEAPDANYTLQQYDYVIYFNTNTVGRELIMPVDFGYEGQQLIVYQSGPEIFTLNGSGVVLEIPNNEEVATSAGIHRPMTLSRRADNVWVVGGDITTFSIPYLPPNGTILDSFPAPAADIRGLAFDGTNLISSDTGTDTIYIHDGVSSTTLSNFPTPAGATSGLVFDGTNLIGCDLGTDTIYIHDGVSSTILSTFPAPAADIRGLAFDGTNLISSDTGTDTIYIHDGVSSTILDSFSSPSNSPAGLAFDGTNLISSDFASDTIYIHDGISSTILDSFPSTPSLPGALTFDGTNLISCNFHTDTIYIHDKG